MLANFVQYARLSGRVLEMFHKSILVRSTDKKTMLLLRADVDAWWNSIPAEMQSCYTSHGDTSSVSYGGGEAGLTKNLFPSQKSTPVYRILHHTLIKHREMMISIL